MTGQLQICFILSRLCVCSNGRLPVNWSLWRLLSRWASVCCPSHSSFRSTLCCVLQFLLPCLVRKRGSCLSPVVIFLFVINLNQQIAILGRRKGEKRRENLFNPRESGGENDLSHPEKWLVFSILCKTQKGIEFILSQSLNLFRNPYFSCAFTSVLYILSQILTSSAVIGLTESFMDCFEMIQLSNVPVGLPPNHCTYREEKPLISYIFNSRNEQYSLEF